MGLHAATADYWNARSAYFAALAANASAGFCVQCEAIIYDPNGTLGLVGAAAVEYAAANYASAVTTVGL